MENDSAEAALYIDNEASKGMRANGAGLVEMSVWMYCRRRAVQNECVPVKRRTEEVDTRGGAAGPAHA